MQKLIDALACCLVEHVTIRLCIGWRTIQYCGFAYLKASTMGDIVDTENIDQLCPKCRILTCHGIIISVVHENRLFSFSCHHVPNPNL